MLAKLNFLNQKTLKNSGNLMQYAEKYDILPFVSFCCSIYIYSYLFGG